MAKRRTTDIFWRKADELPELQALPLDERRRVWQDAYRRSGRDWRTLILWPLFAILFVFAFVFGDWFFASRWNPGLPRIVLPMLLGAVGGFGIAALFWIVHRRVIQRDLWRRLPHLCDGCGYDLTGAASGVCPECGRAVISNDEA